MIFSFDYVADENRELYGLCLWLTKQALWLANLRALFSCNATGQLRACVKQSKEWYAIQLINLEHFVFTEKSQTLALVHWPWYCLANMAKVSVWDFPIKTSLLVNNYLTELSMYCKVNCWAVKQSKEPYVIQLINLKHSIFTEKSQTFTLPPWPWYHLANMARSWFEFFL